MVMANWDKLNDEFNGLINRLTDEDWGNWNKNRAAKREMRRLILRLKAEISASKRIEQQIANSLQDGDQVINTQHTMVACRLSTDIFKDKAGESNYALAA